ncbi:lysosomal alpha-glucosidase-like [Uloborus diversus]|uniref:lysosomal alpha-glucosidase-like n=1 Tax=Uloborus diversus TaxID=327109 RepID=UPI00240953EC|nr:lysosomal alpha-glucosidase-like [Uloborus diversus]
MPRESSDFGLLSQQESRFKLTRKTLVLILAACTVAIALVAVAVWFSTRPSDQNADKNPVCKDTPDIKKFDCHPDQPLSEKQCLNRGCCYAVPDTSKNGGASVNVPYCFYPSDYLGYAISNVSEAKSKIQARLTRKTPSGFPEEIKNLNLVIRFIDDYSLRIKITDADSSRFEVPIPLNFQTKDLQNPLYEVLLNSTTGRLTVSRKLSKTVIFQTELSRLVYANQFLQLSSQLPSEYFYGIGEHYAPLLRNVNWTKLTLMNSDLGPIPNHALYGSHPFYMALEEEGKANGVFLLNSNPMDVILQPTPAITFRPIGGILDFFIMLGPTPENVVQQYTGIIGRTFMPPYWSLGFQLCRYGYNTLNKSKEVLNRTLENGIPLDVQWHDIDYMDAFKDFTYDKVNFKGLPEFVDDLHRKGRHYVLMIDPGISNIEAPDSYPPYDEGVEDDVFVKTADGKNLIGKVWTSGTLVYPDFSNPTTVSYWTRQFKNLHDIIKFDGVWIDMNEPSNFVDGSVDGCPKSSLENPPYLPGDNILTKKTLCMTAKHYSSIHYNEHNLYAYREAVATNIAIRTVRKKRPFIISRASFAGQGVYSGHWSGDIQSTWNDMRYSIPSLLNFNMYGMSMMGSDICGFGLNTTVEMCARWQALGAFYTFSRNHNDKDTIEQDPAVLGPDVVKATVQALSIRYTFLPYLYTLFYRSHAFGDTVVRPLFFEFSKDVKTYNIDEQFLWGPAFMVIPALYPNITTVTAYIPAGKWLMTDLVISKGEYVTLNASLTDPINTAIRGGHVIPIQAPGPTTTTCRENPFGLVVVLDDKQEAFGELYWDDGDSLDTLENENYNLIKFSAKQDVLQSSVVMNGYRASMKLASISLSGLSQIPHTVSLNGIQCSPSNNTVENEELHISDVFNFAPDFNESKNETCGFKQLKGSLSIIIGMEVSLLESLTLTWN